MNKDVVLQKTLEGENLAIRYPKDGDAQSMLQYINTLFKEKTFIRFQGEQLTLKEESKYLKDQLEKIKRNKAVQLLVFVNDKLVGVSEITMKDKVEKHIGVFGISIAKEFRGKGVGKLLMDTVLKEASTNLTQLKMVTLDVFANNSLAVSMYEKYGFIKYGKLPKGIIYKNKYVDDVLMYKLV